MAKLGEKLSSLHVGEQNLAEIERLCSLVQKRLRALTMEEKKRFLRLIVEQIWVDENNHLEIEVIIPDSKKLQEDVNCETTLSLKERGRFFKS